MADTKLAKVGITIKEPWRVDVSYEMLDFTLWRVQDGGDGCGYIAKRDNIGVVPNSDDSVWIPASQAGQSIYDLAVKYGHFEGTEEEFEAEYQAVLQAARDAASETRATNTEIQEAEELRKTAENTRVEAETARQTAESGRQTAETARQTAETARNTAETQRGDNETTRQSQETARESAEQTRQTNESTRQSNETARESAERERTADFEALKTDMETAIGEADAATAAAVALNNQVAGDESARQTAESGRVAAETQRASAETQRGTNESTRQTQETARQTAEQTRNTQESTRQTQETARQTAEQGRASAESQRVSNETARQTAETAREAQSTSDHQRAEEDHAVMAGYDDRLSDVEGDVTELQAEVTDLKKQNVDGTTYSEDIVEAEVDASGKTIETLDKDGKKAIYCNTEFKQDVDVNGDMQIGGDVHIGGGLQVDGGFPSDFQKVGTTDKIDAVLDASQKVIEATDKKGRKIFYGGIITPNETPFSPSPLFGKKWVVIGDSFTNGGVENGTIEDDGPYFGMTCVYPYIIGNRTGVNIVKFFGGGQTIAFPAVPGDFTNSITCPTSPNYYQNIPADADYITIYLGINDANHAPGGSDDDGEDYTGEIPLGTPSDNTTDTYYGAWNVVLSWLRENRPFAHIGIIVCNGITGTSDYMDAQIAMAKKYGYPYLNLNGDERCPAMIRTCNPLIPSSIKNIIIEEQAVDYDGSQTGTVNKHPNRSAHLLESTFIENFLKSL